MSLNVHGTRYFHTRRSTSNIKRHTKNKLHDSMAAPTLLLHFFARQPITGPQVSMHFLCVGKCRGYPNLPSSEDCTTKTFEAIFRPWPECQNIQIVFKVSPLWLTRRGTAHSQDLSWRGAARAEDAQWTPTQSHISSSMLVYEEYRCRRGS